MRLFAHGRMVAGALVDLDIPENQSLPAVQATNVASQYEAGAGAEEHGLAFVRRWLVSRESFVPRIGDDLNAVVIGKQAAQRLARDRSHLVDAPIDSPFDEIEGIVHAFFTQTDDVAVEPAAHGRQLGPRSDRVKKHQ